MTFTFASTYAALWFLVLAEGVLALVLLRTMLELRHVVDQGLETRLRQGSRAPLIAATDSRSGAPVSSDAFRGHDFVILFLSTKCSICSSLVDSLCEADLLELPQLVIVSDGELQALNAFDTRAHSAAILDPGGALAAEYGVRGYPTAIAIDADLRITRYGNPRTLADLRRTARSEPPEDAPAQSRSTTERARA